MKKVLFFLRDSSLVSVVIAIALLLILSKILQSLDVSLTDIWKKFPEVSVLKSGDVQNYVLFTILKYPPNEVVTGTKYASLNTSKIIEQWCYLGRMDLSTGVRLRMNLAKKDQSGSVRINTFKDEALSQFGLSAQDAKGLVTSHCRFK